MLPGETENTYLTRIGTITIKKCSGLEDWVGAQIIDFVPDDVIKNADIEFRDGWDWTTPEMKMDYNLPVCREIQRKKLRALREPKLRELDIAYQRADEVGDITEKQRIAMEKQKLRDVTADPGIDAAQTPEELKEFIPDILK